MNKKILTALALAALSGAAFAGFGDADVDQSGALSAEEAMAAGWNEEQIKAADTNADGSVDEAEYKAATGEE